MEEIEDSTGADLGCCKADLGVRVQKRNAQACYCPRAGGFPGEGCRLVVAHRQEEVSVCTVL